MFGFLNINKPSGMSSHKVISVLRKITGIKQIGHAGTLDPLASGVLPVAIGKASKLIDYMTEDKAYSVGIYLGKVSDTFDMEGEVVAYSSNKVTREEVELALEKFRGEIEQVPPAFSAIHYNGKRLYELAREGIIPDDIPKRKITIYKNEIIEFDYENQILKLDIECSKGTYIRSIVNDLGQNLGVGGVMFELVRTKSSGFEICNSLDLDDSLTKDILEKNIINPIAVLNLECIEISNSEIEKIKNGNKFKNTTDKTGNVLLVLNEKILALAVADEEDVQPKKVFL